MSVHSKENPTLKPTVYLMICSPGFEVLSYFCCWEQLGGPAQWHYFYTCLRYRYLYNQFCWYWCLCLLLGPENRIPLTCSWSRESHSWVSIVSNSWTCEPEHTHKDAPPFIFSGSISSFIPWGCSMRSFNLICRYKCSHFCKLMAHRTHLGFLLFLLEAFYELVFSKLFFLLQVCVALPVYLCLCFT